MEEIIYIMLGWSLGLLSPSIIKKISEKTEKTNLEKIIFNDLKELKKRLAPLAFSVYPKYGKLDRKTFEWLKINSGIDFTKGTEQFFKEDLDIDKMLNYLNTEGMKESTSVYFKKMHLFAIDSHLMNFGIVDTELMEKVLEVRFRVEAFNEDVDSFREYFRMTFVPGITDTNYEIICQEIKNKSLDIAKKSIYIVNNINNILKHKEALEESIKVV